MAIKTNWNSLRTTHKENRSRRGKGKGRRMSLLWLFGKQPITFHFQRPEKPYINPLDGSENPIRVGFRHWLPGFGKGKGLFMECGGEKCTPCALGDPQKFGLDRSPDLLFSKNDRQAELYISASMWIEEKFHITEQQRRDGNGTYKARILCEGHGCQYCKARDPKVFGKRAYSTFSLGQWLAVFQPLSDMAKMYDKSGNRLLLFEYVCAECGEVVIDFLNHCPTCNGGNVEVDLDHDEAVCSDCETSWSIFPHENENVDKTVREEIVCTHCGHKGILEPIYWFADPNVEGEIDQYDLFDLRITMHKNEKGQFVVDSWDISEPDERLFDPKHQGGDEAGESIAKRHAEPVDLDSLLEPDSSAAQAALLGRGDPFGTASEGHRHRQYNPNSAEGDTEEGADK